MELQLSESKKTKRRIHSPLRIDMTPMVDLGFLLITFFIFTTTMSEKKAMKLFMPADKGTSVLGQSRVLTVLLDEKNKVYAYEGKFEDALSENKIISTTYNENDGIANLIRGKQKQLQQSKYGKNALVFLIKPTARSSYKNIVDHCFIQCINDVQKYMIVNPSEEEKSYLQNK